jgi:hypothetical protein
MSKLRIPFLSGLPRPVALGLMAFGSTLLAVLLVFGADRLTNGGEILGAVSAGDVDLGGLGEADASSTPGARGSSARLRSRRSGYNFQLDPAAISFELDEETMVAAAMRHGRSGNILGQLGWWVGHFGEDSAAITPVLSYDGASPIIRPGRPAASARPIPAMSHRGRNRRLSTRRRASASTKKRRPTLEEALLDSTRSLVRIDTHLIDPDVTSEEIDAAVQRASELIAGDVTLTEAEFGFELVLPRHLLARALVISRQDNGAAVPGFDFEFDEEAILAYVAALGPYLGPTPTPRSSSTKRRRRSASFPAFRRWPDPA